MGFVNYLEDGREPLFVGYFRIIFNCGFRFLKEITLDFLEDFYITYF